MTWQALATLCVTGPVMAVAAFWAVGFVWAGGGR